MEGALLIINLANARRPVPRRGVESRIEGKVEPALGVLRMSADRCDLLLGQRERNRSAVANEMDERTPETR
jgi:hypothetical protein